MKLVIIFGGISVDEMTVGQELAKITDLKLFHNHTATEPAIKLPGYYNVKAAGRLRRIFFEEFSKSNNYGMIFTYVWAADRQGDWECIKDVSDLFEKQGADIFYVELVSSQEIRAEERHDGEIAFTNYIKLDNSELAPDVAARMIKEKFNL